MKQIDNVEIGRLKALTDLLDTVPIKQFDMDGWQIEAPRAPSHRFFGLIQTDPGCGFAGCAMGWAAHDAIIPGLYIEHGVLKYHHGGLILTNFDAVEAATGLSYEMAVYLFHPKKYQVYPVTPEVVARRLRRFITKIEAIRRRDQMRRMLTKEQVMRLVAA